MMDSEGSEREAALRRYAQEIKKYCCSKGLDECLNDCVFREPFGQCKLKGSPENWQFSVKNKEV